MQTSKNDVWVGLFVLIGAAAILFLALQSANLLSLNFEKTYHVVGRFDNIGGLKPKAAVRSAGSGAPAHGDGVGLGEPAQPLEGFAVHRQRARREAPLDLEMNKMPGDAWQKFGPTQVPVGDCAAVRIGGVEVVLNAKRTQATGLELFTNVGIDPTRRKIVVVKSTNHFMAAYGLGVMAWWVSSLAMAAGF